MSITKRVRYLPGFGDYESWVLTRTTLHLFLQIVGKALLNLTTRRNHWWHSTFKITPHGLASDPFVAKDQIAQFSFDLEAHRFRILDETRDELSFELTNNMSVAEFLGAFTSLAARAGIKISIDRPVPYDHRVTTPFAEDDLKRGFDPAMATSFGRVLIGAGLALERFSSGFTGKRSPVQLFWHAMDLAVSVYSGEKLPVTPGLGTSARDAFSHQCGGAGFKAGDDVFPFPFYFSYLFPADDSITSFPLFPEEAYWSDKGGMIRAILPYDVVRASADPDGELDRFFTSAYEEPARALGWDVDGLRYLYT